MSQFTELPQREVSESAFEYLLSEILAMQLPSLSTNNTTNLSNESNEENSNAISSRLDKIGYDVGYR
jgi:hypothetical protein